MNDILLNLSKALPAVAVIAALFAYIGWAARASLSKPEPAKAAKPAPSNEKAQQQDRAKNLEAALEKSKAANKALKAELENVQSASVSKATLDSATAELDTARKVLESETKRASALETELKKSQETVKHLNSRANDADKAQKDRSFSLENELSKAREQLAQLQNRPDDSAELQAEIERLRESVAVSTRFAGEMRKREAAAVDALEKAEARLASALESGRDLPAAPSKKIGPVGDSDRIAAAKAEVLRLVELNKQRAVVPAVAAVAVTSIVEEEAPAEIPAAPVEEEIPAVVSEPLIETPEAISAPALEVPAPVSEPAPEPTPEPAAPISESVPEAREEKEPAPAPAAPKPPANGELFTLD